MSKNGFAALANRGGNGAGNGSKKIVMTVKAVIEENNSYKLIASDQDGAEYKIRPRVIANPTNGTTINTFDEGTRPGSVFVTRSVTKVGDEYEMGFMEWINRYPGINVVKTLDAIGLSVQTNAETGKTNTVATILDVANKITINAPEDIERGVDAAINSDIVPASAANRGLVIAYKNKDGHVGATVLTVGTQKLEDGTYVTNDIDAWRQSTINGLKEALAVEVANGSTDITLCPATRMYGSQNMLEMPKNLNSKMVFPNAVSQFVTSTWQSNRDPSRNGKRYGVQECVASFQPIFDTKSMGKELSKLGGDPVLFKLPTGNGYNGSAMALMLKKLGGEPEKYIDRYIVGAIATTGYPSPKPMAYAVLGMDWRAREQEQGQSSGQAVPTPAQAPEQAHGAEHVDEGGLEPIDEASFDDLDAELATLSGGPSM